MAKNKGTAQNNVLNLQQLDLPHERANGEWWYFHAHLRSLKDKREFALFATIFQTLFRNTPLYYTHSSLLDVKHQKYYTRSKGDPRGPELIRADSQPGPTDYLKLALQEVFQTDTYPLPDQKSASLPQIDRNSMDYVMDDMRIYKDDQNHYHLEVKVEGDYGFDLQIRPTKPPILNGINGVVDHLNMFYYSITRMAVTGSVTVGQDVYPIEGHAWYDHQFSDQTDKSNFFEKKNEWIWMGIQLENQTELVYNPQLMSIEGHEGRHKSELLYISPEGERSYYDANLIATERWASMRTFIEYEVAWLLYVEALDLELHLKADIPHQEFISIVAQPAYWEGRIQVEGTLRGAPIKGLGFVEQAGKGSRFSNYKSYLASVSRQTLRAVARCYPLEPTFDDMRRLIADPGFEVLLDGVSRDSFVETMIKPVRLMTDRGGKAWRSMGLMYCIAAVGGDPSAFTDFLALPELLHTGSLIVDDVQDNSTVRRGGKTCHLIVGMPTAINAGTAAYFMIDPLLKQASLPEHTLLRIYQLYFICLRGAHAGQGLDIHGLHQMIPACFETGNFHQLWEAMLAIHRLKSGLAASIAGRIGVALGNGTLRQEEVLGDYFLALGIAFQIMDDVINVRGFHKGLKSKAEDLIAGKITAPVIQAFLALDDESRQRLWWAIRDGTSPSDLPMLLELLEECHAIDACIDYARQLVEEAWLRVESLLPNSYAKLQLRIFGWFVVDVRDY